MQEKDKETTHTLKFFMTFDVYYFFENLYLFNGFSGQNGLNPNTLYSEIEKMLNIKVVIITYFLIITTNN